MNYIRTKSITPFGASFVYFDTAEKYQADAIFKKEKLFVKFENKEFHKKDCPYIIVFATVNKKNASKFIKCMEELENKMILMGYTDYPEFCKGMMEMLKDC